MPSFFRPFAGRRIFLRRLFGLGGAAAAAPLAAGPGAVPDSGQPSASAGSYPFLAAYARAQDYRSLKQSSYNRTGANSDRYVVQPGETKEVFSSSGPGVITHIWFTISTPAPGHLKEFVFRCYWDDEGKPSVEAPVGDFFGLNLGQYFVYQSAFLNCSPVRALNSYFSMPFRRSARLTLTNEGTSRPANVYVNIDYQIVPSLPDDVIYLHAQYRQAAPPPMSMTGWMTNREANEIINLDGKQNYVYCEARGRGHLMGVTLGVLQNQEYWWGEGDDMIFVDDDSMPAINGTGSEDYFLGAFDFGGRDAPIEFSHHYAGAPFIASPERTGGRWCMYRWHGDNPVTFTRYLRHTMEHGHGNHRADSFYSCAYWYQTEPHLEFPALPPAEKRIPVVQKVAGPGTAQG